MSKRTVYKPWGREEWLELNDRYCYKRIYINAGYKTSLQYHHYKYETNYLIDGTAELWLEDDKGVIQKTIIRAGDYFNVQPPRQHRIIALTDIILQEASTPEVDDVIRVEDDTNRKDGKLEDEQKAPAVLILSAGLGSRVRKLAQNKNKTLIPINNKAIISYIIEKFPKEYEIVMAVGYKKESLREYCQIAYPDRKFTFVEVEGWDNPKIGPGSSALQCKAHLQKPFYLVTSDSIIDAPLPPLDGNWLGTWPTGFPEKYSTIKVDEHQNVLEFVNKSEIGFDNAFIGLAGIRDYTIFWSELEEASKTNSEIVAAWYRPKMYPNLKTKVLPWFDTGNIDDIQKTKEHFKDKPLSLYKDIDDIVYRVGQKFLKFSSNLDTNTNRYARGLVLKDFVPTGLGKTDHFIHYDWEPGITLYEHNNTALYNRFLNRFSEMLKKVPVYPNETLIKQFYVDKTVQRKDLFISKYDLSYFTNQYIINGVQYPSIGDLLNQIDFGVLLDNKFYDNFHGDLQFDNIIYDADTDKFVYIDWRESFAGHVLGGDLYYDLSKMYGGCILPYNLLKDDSCITISEGICVVDYEYQIPKELSDFRLMYEEWIVNQGFDLNKIKLIKSLIYLNMSPLHTDKFNKLLWFKAIEGLAEYVNQQKH